MTWVTSSLVLKFTTAVQSYQRLILVKSKELLKDCLVIKDLKVHLKTLNAK